MKNLFTPNRICMAALSSMLGFSAFAADCVINYTNFDTTKETTIGTTKKGIGPTYSDKIGRYGLKVQDLYDEETLNKRIDAILPLKNKKNK